MKYGKTNLKKIGICHRGDRLLPLLPSKAGMYAEQFFEEHNVKVHKKTQFTSKTAEELGYSHVIECLGYTFKTEFMKKCFE